MRLARTCLIAFFTLFAASEAIAQAGYEAVLVPFDTGTVKAGSAGALWSAELRVRNASSTPVNLFPEICSSFGQPFPCERRIVVPPESSSVVDVLTGPSESLHGIMLYVPSLHQNDIHFTLHVRDAASEATAGVVVPVVRSSELRSEATIVGVAISPGQRRTLRVYQPQLRTHSTYRVRVIDEATNVTVFDSRYARALPTDPPFPVLIPATFDFSDSLESGTLAGASRVRVLIESAHGVPFWPMVTVTGSDSSVAVYTPN